jgi:hypothetical protein
MIHYPPGTYPNPDVLVFHENEDINLLLTTWVTTAFNYPVSKTEQRPFAAPVQYQQWPGWETVVAMLPGGLQLVVADYMTLRHYDSDINIAEMIKSNVPTILTSTNAFGRLEVWNMFNKHTRYLYTPFDEKYFRKFMLELGFIER